MRSLLSILLSLALFYFVHASDSDKSLEALEEEGFSKRGATPLATMRFGKRSESGDDLDELLARLADEEELVRKIRSSPLGTMRFGKRSGPLTTMRFGKRAAPLASMRFGRR